MNDLEHFVSRTAAELAEKQQTNRRKQANDASSGLLASLAKIWAGLSPAQKRIITGAGVGATGGGLLGLQGALSNRAADRSIIGDTLRGAATGGAIGGGLGAGYHALMGSPTTTGESGKSWRDLLAQWENTAAPDPVDSARDTVKGTIASLPGVPQQVIETARGSAPVQRILQSPQGRAIAETAPAIALGETLTGAAILLSESPQANQLAELAGNVVSRVPAATAATGLAAATDLADSVSTAGRSRRFLAALRQQLEDTSKALPQATTDRLKGIYDAVNQDRSLYPELSRRVRKDRGPSARVSPSTATPWEDFVQRRLLPGTAIDDVPGADSLRDAVRGPGFWSQRVGRGNLPRRLWYTGAGVGGLALDGALHLATPYLRRPPSQQSDEIFRRVMTSPSQ